MVNADHHWSVYVCNYWHFWQCGTSFELLHTYLWQAPQRPCAAQKQFNKDHCCCTIKLLDNRVLCQGTVNYWAFTIPAFTLIHSFIHLRLGYIIRESIQAKTSTSTQVIGDKNKNTVRMCVYTGPRYNAPQYNVDSVTMRLKSWIPILRDWPKLDINRTCAVNVH